MKVTNQQIGIFSLILMSVGLYLSIDGKKSEEKKDYKKGNFSSKGFSYNCLEFKITDFDRFDIYLTKIVNSLTLKYNDPFKLNVKNFVFDVLEKLDPVCYGDIELDKPLSNKTLIMALFSIFINKYLLINFGKIALFNIEDLSEDESVQQKQYIEYYKEIIAPQWKELVDFSGLSDLSIKNIKDKILSGVKVP